jgi:hypothetical protein
VYSCGSDPVGLALADFNGDGLPDIAVANGAGVAISGGTGYDVNVLLATGAGTYGSATPIQVGASTTAATGVTSPTGIAAGGLNSASNPTDLAVSGGNSTIEVLLNTTAKNATRPTFTTQDVANGLTTTTSGVAIDKIDGSNQNAIIAETTNGPIAFQNAGGANFGTAGTGGGGIPLYFSELTTNPLGSNPGAFALDANSPTGLNDLLVANASSSGSVIDVQNTSFKSSISIITEATTTTDYIIHTASVAGLSNGSVVMISGDTTDSINGVWKISNVTSGGGGSSFEIPVAWAGDRTFGGRVNWYAVQFSPTFTTTSVDANPVSLALVDVNGDGQPDLFTGNSKNGDVSVALANGARTFQTSTDVTLTSSTPTRVAMGDLNGDGTPDLVVADSNNSKVWVFLGNGDGTYKAPVGYTTLAAANGSGVVLGHNPIDLALANLGGTGLDIVTLSQADDVVSILANNGSGVFATPITYAVSSTAVTNQVPTALVAGNFGFTNGAVDLAVGYKISGANDGGVSILLGASGQADKFTYAAQPATSGIGVTALATGNFTNRSGELDLTVAGSTNQSAGNVEVLYPTAGSAGVFTQKFTISNATSGGAVANLPLISSLAVGDVNREGFADIVAVSSATSSASDNVFVLLNSAGFAAFGQDFAVPAGTALQSVGIMNVPGNAFPNLIVTTTGQGNVPDNVLVIPNTIAPANRNSNRLFGYQKTPFPYQVGSGGQPVRAPSTVAVVSDPFITATTFLLNPTAPTITSGDTTTFVVGTAGNFPVATSFSLPSPLQLTEAGALPGGVAFIDNHIGTAMLAGNPTGGGGVFPFTITASNGVSPDGTQNFTLTVDQSPAITSSDSTTFTAGTSGSFTVTATGYPAPTYTLSRAPVWLSIDNTTGVMTGTPANLGAGPFSFNFTITASNGIKPSATQNFTLKVALTVDQSPAITSSDSTTFTVGTAGSFAVTATGDPAPAYTLSGAPAWLSINNTTGVMTGTAPNLGAGPYSFNFTITASNGVAPDANQTFMLMINPAPSIRGTVFLDVNANGVLDSGEGGLGGRTVFLDLNHDGTLDANDPTAVTDASGNYTFGNLTSGSYTVRQQLNFDNVTRTGNAANGIPVNLGAAGVSGVNFGDVMFAPAAPVIVNAIIFGTSNPDANTAYVRGLYQAVLGRSPSAVELQDWLTSLNGGQTHEQVALGFIQSPEHRGLEVDDYYRSFLHRTESASERQNWVNVFLAGETETDVVEGFINSAEYQSEHGGDAAFAQGLYVDVLGRQGSNNELSAVRAQLSSGASRAGLIDLFVHSNEANRQAVLGFYAAYLHRSGLADPGSAFWVNLLNGGAALGSVQANLLGDSPFHEFFNDGAATVKG